jgi:hypothetical protein
VLELTRRNYVPVLFYTPKRLLRVHTDGSDGLSARADFLIALRAAHAHSFARFRCAALRLVR